MTREQKEDALVADLEAVITDAQIEPFPDNLAGFKGKKDKVILVGYFGKNRISKVNKRGTLQNFDDRFIIRFGYRNRRTHQGVLKDLKLAEDKLAGKNIDNNFLSLADEDFREYNDQAKRWVYDQTWGLFERYDNT